MNSNTIAYLGAPYSHPNPEVQLARLEATTKMALQLFKQGRFVYSPLTHNIAIVRFGLKGDFSTWGEFDLTMLARCDELLVYTLPGWKESKGLAAEIAFAKANNISISYLEEEVIA